MNVKELIEHLESNFEGNESVEICEYDGMRSVDLIGIGHDQIMESDSSLNRCYLAMPDGIEFICTKHET